MPSITGRTVLAAAAVGVAAACLAASAAAARTTTKLGDEFHSKTVGCTASRDMHRHDVVVRCGQGHVGEVDWTFRMRSGAGIQNASAKVCTYGGSCTAVAAWQLQTLVTTGGRHILLVKVPFVGRSPDVTKVVATVT
jgi:hypothetical protein